MGEPVTAADVMASLQTKDTDRSVGNLAAVVLLDQDPMLAKLVAVWPNVPVAPLPLRASPPSVVREGDRIRWLWSLIDPEPVSKWLEIAGLPDASHTRRACQIAIDNRMVLPDGTVSRWAAQYIRNLVGGTLARRGVREAPAPAPTRPAPPAAAAPSAVSP